MPTIALFFFLALLSGFAFAMPPPLCNTTAIDSCGCIADSPNTIYTLNASLNYSSICINVAAENVTIDCAGYAITGDNTSGQSAIYSNYTNTSIQNCAISNYYFGIYYYGSSNGRITNTNVTQTSYEGIRLEANSENNTLSNIYVDSDGNALGLQANSNGNLVTNITATSTSSSNGVVAFYESHNNVLANSTFISQNQNSTLVYFDALPQNNTLYWNNFTQTSGYYVNDFNGGNVFNGSAFGIDEGNIYYDVISGVVKINGTASSSYGSGFYVGSDGFGYPFDNATSGKMYGATDYAPLTPFNSPFPCNTTSGNTALTLTLNSPLSISYQYVNDTMAVSYNVTCNGPDSCTDIQTQLYSPSGFTMSGDLQFVESTKACIFSYSNDDHDSVTMWADLTGKISNENNYYTDGMNWMTWERDGTENMAANYLPNRPSWMGPYARPAQLFTLNKTVWFDWQNSNVVWDGANYSFASLGLNPGDFSEYDTYLYIISDGGSKINVGHFGGNAKLLTFSQGSVTSSDVATFAPSNPIYSDYNTEEDAFGNVLFLVNDRIMYFDGVDGVNGYFALAGTIDDPNSQYTRYVVPYYANPDQPGMDFFVRVDNDGYVWFGDWGHDNGGYFNCGNDNYLGVIKTNIRISSKKLITGLANSTPFSTAYPSTFNLCPGATETLNLTLNSTAKDSGLLFASANLTQYQNVSADSSSISYVTYAIDGVQAVQISPVANSYARPGDSLTVQFGCKDAIVDTAQLWSNYSGTWAMDAENTTSSDGDSLSYTYENVTEGMFNWAVWCNSSNSYSNWTSNLSINVTTEELIRCGDTINESKTYRLLQNASNDSLTYCFNIEGIDNVTIDCEGHKISDTADMGIYVTNANNFTIKNCVLSGMSDGIFLINSSNGTLTNNTLIDDYNGVYLESNYDYDLGMEMGSNNNVITGNNFSSNDYGVYVDYSNNNNVTDNTFDANYYGFYLYYADNNQIGRNNLTQTYDSNFGSGSCPFLYLWNGTNYSYYTDLAGEPLGVSWFKPKKYEAGIYELGDFQPVAGTYTLKVRETIPESDFFDQAKLLVVDVPEGYDVLNTWSYTYPFNTAPTKQFMTIKDSHVPVSATDSYGNDVLSAVSYLDGNPVKIQNGVQNPLTLDFGTIANPQYAKLIITGWAAYSQNSGAAAQNYLLVQTKDGSGSWVTRKSFGSFIGDSRTIVFNISDVVSADNTEIRIIPPSSSSTIHIIDRVLLDDSAPVPYTVTEVSPSAADLRYGGFASYEYATTEHRHIGVTDESNQPAGSNLMWGNFTAYGDVLPLLGSADDRFVVMRSGDELAFEFPAPAQAPGTSRKAFMLADVMYSVKYSINGFVRDSIEPMPFHGMDKYPYNSSVSYPNLADSLSYRSTWNTRAYDQSSSHGAGISLPYSFNNSVFDNVINGAQYSYGLYLDNEDNTKLLNNNISNVEYGIYLYSSKNSNVSGNRITNFTDYGIYAYYENYNGGSSTIKNNVIRATNDTSYSTVGIDLYDSYSCTVESNTANVYGGRAMMVHSGSEENVISYNNLTVDASEDCGYGGMGCGAVFVGYSYDNAFNNNRLNAIEGKGFAIGGSNSNNFTENFIKSTDYAIYVSGDDYNRFVRNKLVSDHWVYDNYGGNDYSDDYSGNVYYLYNRTPVWELYSFNWADVDGDGWADEGSDLPLSYSLLNNESLWYGSGEDYHPAMIGTPVDRAPRILSFSPTTISLNETSLVTFNYTATAWANLSYCNLTVTPKGSVVGLWHFDDNLSDSSPYANDAAAYGGSFTNESYNSSDTSAYVFDGFTYLEANDSTSLDISGPMTISAWVYPTDDSQDYLVIGKGAFSSNRGYALRQYQTKWEVNFANGNWGYTYKLDSVRLNEWQHVVGVFTGSQINLYIDGVLQTPDGTDWTPTSIDSSGTPLSFAYSPNWMYANTWPGKLDEVAIFKGALDAQQVADLYSQGVSAHYYAPEYSASKANVPKNSQQQFTLSMAPGDYSASLSCTESSLGLTTTFTSSEAPVSKVPNVFGNGSSITTSGFIANLTVEIESETDVDGATYDNTRNVLIKQSGAPVVEFLYNFTDSELDFSKIFVEAGIDASGKAYISIFGFNSSNLVGGKTVHIYNASTSFSGVCIKDEEGVVYSQISSSCSGSNEHFVTCNGVAQGAYTCTRGGTDLTISGLTHSSVILASPPSTPTKPTYNPGSGGGSISRSYVPTGAAVTPVPAPTQPTQPTQPEQPTTQPTPVQSPKAPENMSIKLPSVPLMPPTEVQKPPMVAVPEEVKPAIALGSLFVVGGVVVALAAGVAIYMMFFRGKKSK